MTQSHWGAEVALDTSGDQMFALIADLFPICRSIAGPGLRQTLQRIAAEIPLTLYEVPTGTKAFDWTVPREWECRDAYIKDRFGRRIVDFRASNLHVLNYSVPVQRTVGRDELQQHLYSLPDQPNWIPYRTSYYDDKWGFCVTEQQRRSLTDAEYEVCIDSTHWVGSLSYGECFLAGDSDEEILLSAHCCHPSLANDNLAGIAVAVQLAKVLANRPRRFSYRFLFAPGTIGAIVWLSRNQGAAQRIRNGLVLALLGRPGALVYKRSRRGDAEIDRIAEWMLARRGAGSRVIDFDPYGYDERQFCSPGFNLGVGRLTRAPHGEYREYHTSADNLDLVRTETLADSLDCCLSILGTIEGNRTYRNRAPHGEPQLGRRGLYQLAGGGADAALAQQALLWVLNLSDGSHSLLDVVQRSGLDFDSTRRAADTLCESGLLEETGKR